jgi:uncharacterized protein (TIGR03067 family)
MFRRLMCAVAFVLFCGSMAGAHNKTETDDLPGVWQAVNAECGGRQSTAEQVNELQIVIQGDRFEIKPDGEGRKTTFKLDTSKSPKTIDLTVLDGSNKGKVVHGIYFLEGGQLKVCINLFGKDQTQRPTEYKTQSGDGFGFASFRRANQR